MDYKKLNIMKIPLLLISFIFLQSVNSLSEASYAADSARIDGPYFAAQRQEASRAASAYTGDGSECDELFTPQAHGLVAAGATAAALFTSVGVIVTLGIAVITNDQYDRVIDYLIACAVTYPIAFFFVATYYCCTCCNRAYQG